MRHTHRCTLMALLLILGGCASRDIAPKAVNSYYNIGAQAMARGDEEALHGCQTNALKSYLKAVELFTLSDNQKALATAFNNIGTLYLKVKKPMDAMPYFAEALSLHHDNGDIKGEIRVLTNMAASYLLSGEMDVAEAHLDRADALALSSNTPWAPNRLGRVNLLLKKGEATRALAMVLSLDSTRKAPDDNISAAIYYATGRAFLGTRQYKEALEQFHKALELDRKRGALRLMADDLREAAACLEMLKRYQKAAWYLRRAMKVMTLLGDGPEMTRLAASLESLEETNKVPPSPVTQYFMNRWTQGETFAAPCN